MASIAQTEREYASTRRSAFQVPPSERPMPAKALAPAPERLKPSVSRSVAEIAAHLSQNPVFEELFSILRDETLEKFRSSPIGPEGGPLRELARYELDALDTIENRIASMAAEFRSEDGTE